MTNIGGNEVYSFEQCKELASTTKDSNGNNYTSFSITPSQTWDSLSNWLNNNKSEIISDLSFFATPDNNATQIFSQFQTSIDEMKGYGQCYASNSTIPSKTKIAYTSPDLYTVQSVVIPLSYYNATLIEPIYEDASTGEISSNYFSGAWLTGSLGGTFQINFNALPYVLCRWELSTSNSKCYVGGGINTESLVATYGANCAAATDTSKGCPITKGNYTQNALLNIKNGSSMTAGNFLLDATFPIGSVTKIDANETTFVPDTDPCPKCENKNYSIAYQCGKNPNKIINISGSSTTSATGNSVTLDCINNFLECYSGIGISDDGDIKTLQGLFVSGGIQTKEVTADLTSFNYPAYSGTLVSNPTILTSTYWTDVLEQSIIPNILYQGRRYNVFAANGTSLTKNQMIVSPSATCYIIMGESGFLTITYFVKLNSCSSPSGNQVGLIPTSGTQMAGQEGPVPTMFAVNQIINESYIDNLGKKGYVDDNLQLHEYQASMLPSYKKTHGISMTGTPLTINSFTPTSLNQCQVLCDGNNNCNYFNYSKSDFSQSDSNVNCTFYSSGNTGTSSNTTLYTKIQPSEKNDATCPFMGTENIISTSDWENYVQGEQMSSTTSCFTQHNNYLNNNLKNVQNIKNQATNELQKQTNQTNNYLQQWQKTSTDYEKTIKKIKKSHDIINNMNGIEGFNTIGTVNTMFQDYKELQNKNRYRNIFWSFLAITILIMVMRVLYLYSK